MKSLKTMLSVIAGKITIKLLGIKGNSATALPVKLLLKFSQNH